MKSKLTRILLGSASLALLACQAVAEGKITGITTTPVAGGLNVQIKGEMLTAPKITRVAGGRSFMLEFDASLTSDPQWLRVEQGGVHYVQSVSSQSNPAKIRISFRVDPNTKLDVNKDNQGYLVKATNDEPAAPPKVTTTTAAPVGSQKLYHHVEKLEAAPVVEVAKTTAKGHMVSLDFVNTDVVQILKALALEANVNIVTAPDVKGTLTVSLGTVSTKEALDLVTTMAGLKYELIGGNTYVVTSSANIGHVVGLLKGTTHESSETRVVPIYSGEGTHIKDALRPTASDVEILLPSEKAMTPVASLAAQEAINGQPLDPKTAAATQTNTANTQSNTTGDSKTAAKDSYLVLVGPATRVDQIEREVKDVDEQMCHVLGVDYPLTNSMVRQTYHPVGSNAATLLQAVAPSTDKTTGGQYHAKVGTVEIYATPTGSTSSQSIVLYGRETEVNRLVENLQSIDQLSESSGNYVVYGVKYLDPRSLREDLVAKFPGLSVNVPPSSVGNPGVYAAGMLAKENQDRSGQTLGSTQTGATGSATGAPGGGSSSSTTSTSADNGQTVGLTSPFAADEAGSVPMKLVLRGAPDQMRDALSYLAAIDVAPKQVALELRVMELTKEDALNLGINWSILSGGKVQAIQIDQNGGSTPANTSGFPNATGATALIPTAQNQIAPLSPGGLAGQISGIPGGGTLGITATLDQLAGSNKMIARPNILALDGRESEMFVGDDVKYIQSIQSTQNGVSITTGDVEVGVKLAVLPRIGADGSITMDLRPMVSTLNSFTQVPGGGEIPQTGLRIAQSTMIMKSGETIAIGGLIQDTDSKSRSGIPILSQIPILGLLFSRVNNDHQRTEIVFFLTAKVVDDGNIQNAANPMRHDAEERPMQMKKRGQH